MAGNLVRDYNVRTMTLEGVRYNEAGMIDLESRVDEPAIRAYIESRFSTIPRVDDPVPHIIINDALHPDFYRNLADAWPSAEFFKRDKAGLKYDLVPGSSNIDRRSAGYERLPAEQRGLWDFFVSKINREMVAPLLIRLFEPEINTRLARIREAYEAGLIDYAMAGISDWSYRANVGRFMMRANGYELKPHVDSMPYLVTVLHYFPDNEGDDHSGTIFYKAERPLDFITCVRNGSTQYFHEAGIPCREVLRVPFRPNTMVAFPNMLDSAHGAMATSSQPRKIFQYHISLKGDDEKV
jgi:hypothetical protein